MHHLTLDKVKYYVAIGFMKNDIYEIYTGENYDDNGDVYIPSKIKDGNIIKKASGKYVFKNGDDVEYELYGYHKVDTAEALTRQISLSLRHGTSIHFVIEQLQKGKNAGLHSYTKVLARVLKKYIPENTTSTTKCEKCKSKMIYEDGCVICKQCGYSHCS